MRSATGNPVGVNPSTSWNPGWIDDVADTVMVEDFATGWPSQEGMDTNLLLRQMDQVDRQTDTEYLLIGMGRRDQAERARFAYAAYLLVARPGVHHRFSDAGLGYREWWHYSIYDIPLGKPLGPRVNQGGGIWTRDFEHARVRVDLGGRTGTVTAR